MNNTEKVLRCAIYIRVSTEEQNLNGLSLPAQRKSLVEYAESHKYTIVDFYADEGISARKPMKHRKALLRLLEDVKQNKLDMILVTKLDRWFRNIKDYNITEEILQFHHCNWKTIFENYDSSTANGQMVINIMLSVNQAECDRTSERIKAVLDYKRSIGEVTSGRCACYGYKVENNKLIKDTEVAPIIDDAYQYYFGCFSIRRTIKYLQDKYGEYAPSANKIDRLFKNETYAGIDHQNANYCEPYLTMEQHQRMQAVTQSKVITGQLEPYIFSSLIKCPVCGNNFTGFRKKKIRKNGDTSIYIRYRCGNKFRQHPSANLAEKTIEDYLIANIFIKIKEEIKEEMVTLKLEENKQEKKSNAFTIEKELDRLNMQFQKGRISEAYYDEQYELLSAQLKEFKNHSTVSPEPYTRILETFSGDWLDLYGSLDREHKRAFWKNLISSIMVDGETHQVCGFNLLK